MTRAKFFKHSDLLAEQRRIVAELDASQAEVDALKRLQAETTTHEMLKCSLPSFSLRPASVFALLRRDRSARQAAARGRPIRLHQISTRREAQPCGQDLQNSQDSREGRTHSTQTLFSILSILLILSLRFT